MRQSFLQAAILAGAALVGPSMLQAQTFDAYAPQDPYLQGAADEVTPPLVPPAPYDTPGSVVIDDTSTVGGEYISAPTIDDFPQNPGMIPDYAAHPVESYLLPAHGEYLSAAIGPQTIAPNMIGDFFGVSGAAQGSFLSVQTAKTRLAGSYRNGSTGELLYFPASLNPGGPGSFVELTASDNLVILGDVDGAIPAGTVWTSSAPIYNGPGSTPDTFDLAENPVETAAVNTAYPAGTPATFVSGRATRNPDGSNSASIFTDYIVHRPSEVMTMLIPDPGSAPGAFVGRQKISDNSSPIPRSRVFVNYSYFDNVPLTPQGMNVSRVTPGFEFAFFDDNLSIEVRTPFASTLDSDMDFFGRTSTSEIEFGNVTAYLKALMWESDTFSWSSGIGMTLPTADGIEVSAAGRKILEIENSAYHVLPFLGFLWTPSERWFAQGFLQFDIDTSGNPVYVSSFRNGVPTGNMYKMGNAEDSTYAFIDLGIGYWMYRNRHCDGFINGIAPTVELHYNAATEGADTITRNSFDRLGANVKTGSPGDLEVTNVVLGMTAVVGDSGTLTLGYSTPVSGDDQYDGQFRAFFNWFFGPQTY